MAVNNKNSKEEQALNDFLLDIECLDSLADWTSKFNLFDILKITRAELRHSNVLSWLINPNENHGLSDSIIRGFIQYVLTSYSEDVDIFDRECIENSDNFIRKYIFSSIHLDNLIMNALHPKSWTKPTRKRDSICNW